MKIFLWILGIIAVLIIVVGVFIGYSYKQLQNPKQKNLGVKYTMADYDNAVKTKAKVEVPVPSSLYLGSNFVAEGSQKIDQIFSDAEISAIQNYSNEAKGPIKDVQIHFTGNNGAEASFLTNFNYEGRQINYPIYVKGTVNQTGPKSFDVKTSQLKAGNLSVPSFIAQKAETEFSSFVNSILANISTLNVEKVEINNGSVHFVGTIPTKATGI